MLSKNDILITGMGAVTPAGLGVSSVWNLAYDGKSYLRNGLGAVKTNADFAVEAARQALSQAGWKQSSTRDGFILATTTGAIALWEKDLLEFLRGDRSQPFSQFPFMPIGYSLERMKAELQIPGPACVVTTACAAGIHAIGLARDWLLSGKVDRCLVGGVEHLCELTVQGFRSLQLLSSEQCLPFDKKRTGINLAEGAAFLCLEKNTGKPALAKISGVGASMDAYHMTSPEPMGRGSLQAMRSAIEMANVSLSEIDWVHAHGTGSTHNDHAEANAIASLFEGQTVPPVSSTKGAHGHLLGAAGVLEVAMVVESIQKEIILPTAFLGEADPEIKIQILREPRQKKIRHAIKNILGFGGTNGAVVVSSL